MNKESYFISTPLFKEYQILNCLLNNKNITQRDISNQLNISLSLINDYLEKFVNSGYLIKEVVTLKNVTYHLTDVGLNRLRYLNVGYLKETQDRYGEAKSNILNYLYDIKNKGYINIILYGAGEVAEIILRTIYDNKDIGINCLAIIDDDEAKQGKRLIHTDIIKIDDVYNLDYDCILVSSYNKSLEIYNKLLNNNKIEKDKIIKFF